MMESSIAFTVAPRPFIADVTVIPSPYASIIGDWSLSTPIIFPPTFEAASAAEVKIPPPHAKTISVPWLYQVSIAAVTSVEP